MKRLAYIVSILTTLCAILLVAGLFTFINITSDLPSYAQLEAYDPPTITRLYGSRGEVIAEYATEKRILVSYNEIPKTVINAFLAAEDQHFFKHHGIDFLGLIRAVMQNTLNILTVNNKRAVGGSTITQQVVKSFLLGNERTLSRKIKEAVLAYRISNAYSKERVLELYLNQIFFGNNSYGLYAASQNYFDKELHELTVADAALLAALPKAPSMLNPFKNYQKTLERRNWVLKRMQEEGFITKTDFQKYAVQPIQLVKKIYNPKYGETFYSEAVKQQVIALYGEEALYERGLVVNTNLDENIQRIADRAFRNEILKYDRRHGWRGPVAKINIHDIKRKQWQENLTKIYVAHDIDKEYEVAVVLNVTKKIVEIGFKNGHIGYIALPQLQWARSCLPNQRIGKKITDAAQVLSMGDVILVSIFKGNKYYSLEQIPHLNGGLIALQPKTGKVLAMIGGYHFKNFFNRAIQAQRQPGSVFKTFVYLTAFENGFTPQSRVVDAPIQISQGLHLPMWSPKNFEGKFQGEVSLETALAESLNIPTIKLMLSVGTKKVIERSVQLGVYDKMPPNTSYSVALGAFETTLMNITNAYNTIASGGYYLEPQLIDSIYDRKGNLIYFNANIVCQGCEMTTRHDMYSGGGENNNGNNNNIDNSSNNYSVDNISNLDEKSLPTLGYFGKRAIQKRYNDMIVSSLQKVIQEGTGKRAKVVGKTMGGKTGTTNKNTDAWFIGFSRDITVGIYLGFDLPRTLGRSEVGATLALPIYTEFMKNVLQRVEDGPIAQDDDEGKEIIPINTYVTDQQSNVSNRDTEIMDEFEELDEEQSYTDNTGVTEKLKNSHNGLDGKTHYKDFHDLERSVKNVSDDELQQIINSNDYNRESQILEEK